MNREIRLDRELVRRSYIIFAVFGLVMGGTVLWAIGGGDKSPAYGNVLNAAIFLGFASAASLLIPFVYYCCPRCNHKLSVVREAKPAIHYYCPDCNIEWDTGWRNRGIY